MKSYTVSYTFHSEAGTWKFPECTQDFWCAGECTRSLGGRFQRNIHVQPLVDAVDGGLHAVEVFGQTADGFLQLSDLLGVAWRQKND